MAKKKKCGIEECFNLTHGKLCLQHSYELRKKHRDGKDCKRDSHLKRKYGISLDEFWVLWAVFKGRCAICDCELKMPLSQRGQPLGVVAIDHDHETGNLRGLLCNACNKGLGLFKDSAHILKKAVDYLEQ